MLSSTLADHEADKWLVQRKYMEFYVLESKLTEFHGNTVFTKPETVYKRWTLLKKG